MQELERIKQKLEYAQQPYNYLVEVLQQAEHSLKVTQPLLKKDLFRGCVFHGAT